MVEVESEAFHAPAEVTSHIDGPVIRWACFLDWLTWRERLSLWIGATTVHDLALRRWPQYARRTEASGGTA